MLFMIMSFVSHVCTVPYTSENIYRVKPEPTFGPQKPSSKSCVLFCHSYVLLVIFLFCCHLHKTCLPSPYPLPLTKKGKFWHRLRLPVA